MARYINECNLILRNLSQELRSKCPTDEQYCCYLHCCFVNRQHKEIWETWYFWFGIAVLALLLVTSATSFLVGMCFRKRHQLIRVHHHHHHQPEGGVAGAASERGSTSTPSSSDATAGVEALEDALSVSAPVTAVTGPDGLIQPYVVGGLPAEVEARYKTQGPQGTETAIFRRHSRNDSLGPSTGSADGEDDDVDDADLGDVAGPLEPAYPPMQPVTIVRGTLPEGGFRRTDTYTELVLPPGYVDPRPSHKQPP
ncbi:uncharacterized protein LOC117653908 [Thrips palmi]|uniref:Uncharacterized protein LOC117653908 n=1 Tax=Thrips palmi TaxID=161013 RepID=A0A6P9AEA8_THRPL|nr:uncharacterized protein LOC117653908 [Thrips palmi]